MNRPDLFHLDAQNYRYGFLSAAVDEVLSRPIGSQLDDEQVRKLDLARAFLTDVVAGAKLVSKGEPAAASALGAVRALGYALGPLAAMEQLHVTTEDDLLDLFKTMLEYVERSARERQLAALPEALQMTHAMFSFLSDSILASLNQRVQGGSASRRVPAIS